MTGDPIRLLDDPSVSEALRADLTHASQAGVHGFDAVAGAASLRAAIAADAGAGAAAGGASVLTKVVLATVVVGGGAMAIWAATRSPAPVSTTPLHGPVAKAEPLEPAHRGASAPEPAPAPAIAPQPAAAEPALPEPIPEPIPEEANLEPEPEAPPKAATMGERAKPRAHRAKQPPAPKAEDFAREARLIADARRKLGTDARAALSLLEDAADEFPRGMLREERQALTIMALAKLGRDDDARARSKKFLRKHGSGPYADAVRRAVE